MRRANKSHKVPNVKLRPAPATARHARNHDPDTTYDRSSDSELPPNASMVDLCPRPFKRFTICATGAVDKPTLFKMAFELGAVSTSDLTDRVTHLVANAHGGAKYLCALERKIPIMTPEWITEAHAIWLRGDDVDVEQSMSKYRLPVFSGVILSLSGIEDVNRRTEINRLVTTHQGVYVKNLERPVRVTHLLCSGDTETEKMKYAEKFNKRKEAHIHLVWEEWFWDCLEFGGRFDERKYQVSRPRPERKFLHENPVPSLPVRDVTPGSHRESAISVEAVKRPKVLKPLIPAGSFTINNLSLDGEEEEMATTKKPVAAVTLQLWQSLLKPRGFELEGGKLVRSPSKSTAMGSPPSSPTRTRPLATAAKEKEKGSVISSFRRANSFATILAKEPTVRQPFRRNPSEAEGSNGRSQGPLRREEQPVVVGLFAGYTFRLYGEARCSNVRSAIENGGGVVTDDDTEETSFIIVRLISGSKLYHDEFDDTARKRYRTECWLEHCVFHERICELDENISFAPLTITTPVPGAENISLSLSGLDQSELCWIRRLVRAVGINLEPTFSRRSTHLICPSGTGAKFDKALEWRIPVLSLVWLENIARTGTIPRMEDYLIHGSVMGVVEPVQKCKGKEKETDYQMLDITNDGSADDSMFVKNAGLLQDPATQPWARGSLHQASEKLMPRPKARSGFFGKPRFLTHESDPPEEGGDSKNAPTSSPPAPPPQSSSPPLAEAESPLPRSTPPVHVSPPRMQITPARQSVVDGEAQGRIPSSSSPSPMKLPPSSSLPDTFASSSPACLPDTDAITKALHESLTSLLGKRPMEEDEAKEAVAVKKGRRVRPGVQSNIVSRDASREQLVSPNRPVMPPPMPLVELDTSLLDGPTEEGISVTYEDPGQVEEKRRLLRMLGGDDAEVGAGSGSGVRSVGGSRRRPKRVKVS